MIAAAILAALCVACLLAFLWPYLLYPRILALLPRRPVAPSPNGHSASLLFCAYNEAAAMPAKLDNLRALKKRRADLEILAFDDGSSDGTDTLLADAGELLTLVRGAGRSGKAAGMKRLAAQATGDVLVFCDANVVFAPDAVENLLAYYADESVGGVCGTLVYTDATSATADVGARYWSLDEKLRTLESATGNVVGADGSIFSLRRDLYPDFPDSVLDDFTVSMHAVFAGKRLVKAPDALAFEESVAASGEEFRRKVRIGARAWHTHCHLRPKLRRMNRLDRFKYTSRKVMRWFGGAFLLAAAVFGLSAIAVLSVPVALGTLLAGLAGLGIVLATRTGPLAKLGEAFRAVFGTLLGVLRAMRGETFVTWSPATSR